MLWYKKFYVTNNYKTQEQVQGISGTTHVYCASLFSPKKFGQKVHIINGKYLKYLVPVLVFCNCLLHKISCTIICSKINAKIPL